MAFDQALDAPAYGSLGTLTRKGGGHVGIIVATDADRPNWVVMLGGNQSDAVSYRSFPTSVLKYNYANEYTPSYNLPSMSGVVQVLECIN